MDFVCVTMAPTPCVETSLGRGGASRVQGARAALSHCGQPVIIDVAWIRVHYTV